MATAQLLAAPPLQLPLEMMEQASPMEWLPIFTFYFPQAAATAKDDGTA